MPESRRSPLLARVALLLFSSTLALVAAEGIYRSFIAEQPGGGGDSSWTQRYRRMNETIYMRSEIDGLVYEPRPSSSIEMEYGVAGFDSERRRWDGTERDQTAPRIEVAIVGDSLVWSEYLAVGDSLPSQTEAILGAGEYRVSNFGVTGYDTTQEAIYYEARVRPHDPDVVVVLFCLNDLFIASGPYGRFGTEEQLALKDEQDRMFDRVARVRRETLDGVAQAEEAEATLKIFSRLLALYRRATFDEHYVDEYTIAAAEQSTLERMRAGLRRLGRAIRDDGATPVLVISPILESWDRYHWTSIHVAVRAAAEAAGFTVHDPLTDWSGSHAAEDLRSPGDNLHYNAHGAGVLAQVLADAVVH